MVVVDVLYVRDRVSGSKKGVHRSEGQLLHRRIDFSVLAYSGDLRAKLGRCIDSKMVEGWRVCEEGGFGVVAGIIKEAGHEVLPHVRQNRRREEWWDNESLVVKELWREKRVRRMAYFKSGLEQDRIAYRGLVVKCRQYARSRYVEYWRLKAEELNKLNDAGAYFAAMKLIYGEKKVGMSSGTVKEGMIKKLDGELTVNQEELMQRWVQHFRDLLNQPGVVSVTVNQYLPIAYQVSWDLGNPFTLDELLKAAAKLANGKVVGGDGVPIEVFKYADSQLLMPAVLRGLNEGLRTGRVDNLLKDVVVSMLFKGKGSRMCCDDYRGLSIMSHLGKMWEKAVVGRLMVYCEARGGIFPESQCGSALVGVRWTAYLFHAGWLLGLKKEVKPCSNAIST
jgi:hypothetical protein